MVFVKIWLFIMLKKCAFAWKMLLQESRNAPEAAPFESGLVVYTSGDSLCFQTLKFGESCSGFER